MHTTDSSLRRCNGFTLMETVIAIGVLAVLLTGFMIVFTPAADGIRRSINSQEADKLLSTLSNELVNPRVPAEGATGFEKAFNWIEESTGSISGGTDGGTTANALLLFQYRGSTDPSKQTSNNGAPEPVSSIGNKKVGADYILVPILRKRSAVTKPEIDAAEGPVFLVKCVQLVYEKDQDDVDDDGDTNEIILSPLPTTGKNRGAIYNPVYSDPADNTPRDVATYPEGVLSFMAEFYQVPVKSHSYISGASFASFYSRATKPVFVRNLAVRR